MVPPCQIVELRVGQEVVLQEAAGELWVGEARGYADEGDEGGGEVGDGGGVGLAVGGGREAGVEGRLCWGFGVV